MIFASALILLGMFGVSLYIFSRISKAVEYFYKKPHYSISVSLSLISSLVIVLGFFRSMVFDSETIKSVLKAMFAYWLGIFMYLFIFVLLADIIYLFVLLFKKLKSKRQLIRAVSILCAVILALSVSVYGFYHASVINIKSYDIDINLNSNMKVVLISDLHLGAQNSEDRLIEMVETINSQNPDIVCICGDIFDNDYSALENETKAIDTLSKMKSKFGVFAVLGNHDAGQSVGQMKSFISSCGFILLEENFIVIDDKLTLVGRADMSPIGTNSQRLKTEETLRQVPDNMPVIVMDHNPRAVLEYKEKADLVMSGHTHQGQCFPGSVLTNMMYEVDYGYGLLDSGLQVVVTSGLGTWGMPMRVGTDSEIVCINLK